MSSSCKAQDVLVALKLLTIGDEPWSFTRLSSSLDLSVGASHNAIVHLRAAGLVFERKGAAVIARRRLADFLVHGVPAVFYPVRGGITRGMPTSIYAPMLAKLALPENKKEGAIPVVWPSPTGTVRGESLAPLYDTVPKAAQTDLALYELLALLDGVRVGRGKERRACADALLAKVMGDEKVEPTASVAVE
jgi:hypothetical protein